MSVRRYRSMEVIATNVGLAGTAQLEGLTTDGTSALPPPKLNDPPKFCGETLETLSSRRRAPKRQKCFPAAFEVLFCNSKLSWVLEALPVCAPPPLNEPSTNNAGSALLGMVSPVERIN